MKTVPNGVFPTMITPYNSDGSIDYGAVKELIEFYVRAGCRGVFAVCQSSEMAYLSLDERIELAGAVAGYSNGRLCVVASGHISASPAQQVREVREISATGIDAFVLVTNRFDPHNEGDDVWLDNAGKLLSRIDDDITLGLYECPQPYKRLVTERILDWCRESGRFAFLKDTCCDPTLIERRLRRLDGSGMKLYNANGQSTLFSLQKGAAGYSGIMANFHPELYVWLCDNYAAQPLLAQKLSAFLSLCAFTEVMHYPSTAKYFLNSIGIKMNTLSRSCDCRGVGEYEQMVIGQIADAQEDMKKVIGLS